MKILPPTFLPTIPPCNAHRKGLGSGRRPLATLLCERLHMMGRSSTTVCGGDFGGPEKRTGSATLRYDNFAFGESTFPRKTRYPILRGSWNSGAIAGHRLLYGSFP
jgi:hypothetical protein